MFGDIGSAVTWKETSDVLRPHFFPHSPCSIGIRCEKTKQQQFRLQDSKFGVEKFMNYPLNQSHV
jgi:hypothetical protein